MFKIGDKIEDSKFGCGIIKDICSWKGDTYYAIQFQKPTYPIFREVDTMRKFHMTKSDLKTGMRVILRNGREYTVALNTCYGDLLLSDEGTYCDMNYNDDLLYYGYCSLDITDIYKPTKTNHMNSENKWEPIWRRNLVDEISLQEAMNMLKKLTGKNIKIVIQ